jgi:NDP-sugar pyrophosphorylase family protein
MKAVILAGGEGTRLRPVTYEIPKPLIPVQGKPAIQYLVENFIAYGCEEIFIIIKEKDLQQFANWGLVFLKNRKLSLKRMALCVEKEALGTFGALEVVREKLKNEKRFFVTNADELKDVDLAKLEMRNKTENKAVTLVLKEMTDKDSFGNVVYNPYDGHVSEFLEKQGNEGGYASLGMYVMTPKVFDRLDEVRKKSGERFTMVEKDLFPYFSRKGLVNGYEHKGQFFPTDDFEKWEKAINDYQQVKYKY